MKCIGDIWLTRFLDRECPTGKVKKIESHLARCAGCRERLEELQRRQALLENKTACFDPASIPEIPFQLPVISPVSPKRRDRFSRGGARYFRFVLRPLPALGILGCLVLFAWLAIGPGGDTGEKKEQICIDYIKVGERPAQTYIIKDDNTRTTIVWAEIKKNGKKETIHETEEI